MMYQRMLSFLVLLLGALIGAENSSFGQNYSISDLGGMVGTNSYAYGINNHGEVVGYCVRAGGARAFLYSAGSVTDLGSLGGANHYALSINSSGQVVGFADDVTNRTRAFLFCNGSLTNLESMGGLESYAYGINDAGQIVGYITYTNGSRAYFYGTNGVNDLGTLGGTDSYGFGVNNLNRVVGSSLTEAQSTNAFYWNGTSLINLNDIATQEAGWELIEARGVNNNGAIVGWGKIGGREEAFLFASAQVTRIGVLPGATGSYAFGINNSNQVVGTATLSDNQSQGFLWANGQLINLNDLLPQGSGWDLREGRGINDLGQIVGWGVTNGEEHAFILSPSSLSDGAGQMQGKTGVKTKNSRISTAQTSVATESPQIAMAALLVTIPPSITTQPVGVITNQGSNVTFSVTATGDAPLSYQWRKNGYPLTTGGNITGATSNILTLSSVKVWDSGIYSVVVSNAVGTAISSNAVLRVQAPSNVRVWGYSSYGQTNVPMGLTNAVAVAGGAGHSLALKSDGKVVGWGLNNSGQTNVPTGLSNVVAIAACQFYSLALKRDGTLSGWGDSPGSIPAGQSNVIAIGSGYSHNLALKNDGKMVAWGSNTYGQTNVPVSLTNVMVIAVGQYHNLALKGDCTVAAWGMNTYGQTNVPVGLTNVVAIAAGQYHSLALKRDGTVVAWGSNNYGQTNVPSGLTNVVAIAAGSSHSLAIKSDGRIVAWGFNAYGQSTIPAGLTNGVATAGGANHSLALGNFPPMIIQQPLSQTATPGGAATFSITSQGSMPSSYQWYFNGISLISGTNSALVLTNVQLSAAGSYYVIVSNFLGSATSLSATLAVPPILTTQAISRTAQPGANVTFSVAATGSVTYQWRMNGISLTNGVGVAGANSSSLTVSNVTLRSSGLYTVVVTGAGGSAISSALLKVMVPGNVVAWGDNSYGQTNVPMSVVNAASIAAGSGYSLSLNLDGTVSGWGDDHYGQISGLQGLTNAQAIASSAWDSLVVRSNGTVATSGYYFGADVPASLTNVVGMAGGYYHYLLLQGDGTVTALGFNDYGQTTIPAGLRNVVAVAACYNYSLALKSDGTVAAWGYNGSGQTTVPAGLTNVVAIAAGTANCLALKSDGTVIQWGDYVMPSVPVGLTNVVAVAAGDYSCFALKADGTIVSWGFNYYGETNVPVGLTNVVAIAAGQHHCLALVVSSPVITMQPLSQTAPAGGNVTFSVVAVGGVPFTYQWQHNGTNLMNCDRIFGCDTSQLLIKNLSDADAENYCVIISNIMGQIVSVQAILTIDDFALLSRWHFDNTNTWAGEQGQLPIVVTNVQGVSSWASNAFFIKTNVAAFLTYRDIELSGAPNITCQSGTVRFWFKPEWNSATTNSGNGPQAAGRFVELGSLGGALDGWSLLVNSNGTQLSFVTQTNGVAVTNSTATINWASNTWHQVVVTYSASASVIYVDGLQVATGTGVTLWPRATIRAQGLRVGSDSTGLQQVKGTVEEMETFNYPLDAGDIFSNYQILMGMDANGDGYSDIIKSGTGASVYYSPNNLTGANPLQVFTPLK